MRRVQLHLLTAHFPFSSMSKTTSLADRSHDDGDSEHIESGDDGEMVEENCQVHTSLLYCTCSG